MKELKTILHMRGQKPNQSTLQLASGRRIPDLKKYEKAPTAHPDLRLSADYSGYYGDPPRIIVPSDHPEIEVVLQEIMEKYYRPEDCDGLAIADAADQVRELILETYDIDRQTLSEDTILHYVAERRNLTTKKFVSREEHDEFKNALLRNEESRMQFEARREEREARQEERYARKEEQTQEMLNRLSSSAADYREQNQEILGAMASKLTDHDQQLAYLHSNAVMKDQLQSDMEKLEKKITDSAIKMNKKIDKIDEEVTKKIQPRSLNFEGSGTLSPSSSPPSSPFTSKGPDANLGAPFPSPFHSSSNSQPAASRPTFTSQASGAHLGAPFPSTFHSSSNSQPAASRPTVTFQAPDAHRGATPSLSSSKPAATGPPFTFQAPGAQLGGGTASLSSSSSKPATTGPPFTFQAPGAQLGGGTASLSSSTATATAVGKPSTETQPDAQSDDSKITAVNPANMFDVLSQIELPTVQGGSTSNITVTDDNAPTISICPTEPIIFPVRTRPFRSREPAKAAPSIQAQPSGDAMNMPAQAQPSGNAMNMPTQAQPSGDAMNVPAEAQPSGDAMNMPARAQPPLFAQFGAPQGWQCTTCLVRNVGLEVCKCCGEERNLN